MMRTQHAPVFARIIKQALGYTTQNWVTPSPIAQVKILYTDKPHPRVPVMYDPTIVILFQGRKIGYVGDNVFQYGAENYLLMTVPLPFECETVASAEQPLVGISIRIDPQVLQELLLDIGDDDSVIRPCSGSCGVNSVPFTEEMLCTVGRLFDAMQTPRDARVLGTEVNMSMSAFHHNFKAVTNTSPMQYLKSYRLHKARLMMLNDGVRAGTAAVRVAIQPGI